jgi:hypothetical protein
MIRPFPLQLAKRQYEFIPQAILNEPVDALARRFGLKIEEGTDDFDYFYGTAASIDDFPLLGDTPFAVMHYKGHPDNTATIYLPFDIKDVSTITDIISRILSELRLSSHALRWQRRDNPDY